MKLRRRDVPGDGSCYFHAVGHQVGLAASDVRRMCAQAYLDRRDDVIEGLQLAAWVFHETGLSVDQYAKAISTSYWGGLQDTRILSDIFQRPFAVYMMTGHGTEARRIAFVGEQHGSRATVFLLYENASHYVVLEPM